MVRSKAESTGRANGTSMDPLDARFGHAVSDACLPHRHVIDGPDTEHDRDGNDQHETNNLNWVESLHGFPPDLNVIY